MIIGIPKEIKNSEERVAIIPSHVAILKERGHRVLVQKSAGLGSGISDKEFQKAGAEIIEDAETIWKTADVICKVKEPLGPELDFLKYLNGKILFTYLHLSGAEKKLTELLLENKVTAIAYETVEDKDGSLPLLKPMSEIAGVLALQEGSHYLLRRFKGRGVTLGEISGIEPAVVVVVGGGAAGAKAARTAVGMGAKVILLEIKKERIEELKNQFSGFKNLEVVESTPENLNYWVIKADLLVGAVLIKGAAAPKVITKEMIYQMKAGSVVVDISIDQGGCTELSRPTDYKEPIFYSENGVIFYCVPNMPSQAAGQATIALTAATFPYLLVLTEKGLSRVIKEDIGLKKGINIHNGYICYKQIAKDLQMMDKYKSQ